MKRTAKKLEMLLVVLTLMVLTSGCATFDEKKMVNISEPSSLADRTKLSMKIGDGIISTAYLLSREETEKNFDEDLWGKGVVAVFLEIQNDSSEGMKLIATTLDAEVKEKDIKKIVHAQTMASKDVFNIARRSPWARALVWGSMTYFVGIIPSVLATNSTNDKMEKNYQEKILDPSSNEIGPKTIVKKFLCFRVSNEEVTAFQSGKMKLIFGKGERLVEHNHSI